MKKQDVLLRISEFVLNNESTAIREELHKYLLLISLHNTDRPLNRDQLIQRLENDLSVTKYPRKLVDTALQSLLEEEKIEKIVSTTEAAYQLKEEAITTIESCCEALQTEAEKVDRLLIKHFSEQYMGISKKELRTILRGFYKHIGNLFYEKGVESALAIIEGKSIVSAEELELLLYSLSEEAMLEELEKVDTSVAKKEFDENKLEEEFNEFLRHHTDDLANYLYTLAISYFIIQLLHLDPECQALSRSSLGQKTLYLDTNCLINAFMEHSSNSKLIKEVLAVSRSLGVSLKYTAITRQEYLNWVNHIKNSYATKRVPPYNRFQKMEKRIAIQLLNDFLKKKRLKPRLTWEGYFARLLQIDSLAANLGFIYEENPPEISEEEPDYQTLLEAVTQMPGSKSPSVIRHDAYHISLIHHKRQEPHSIDFLGPNEWFLTFDTSLKVAERIAEPNLEYKKFQASLHVANWFEIISPVISPTTEGRGVASTYAALFSSTLPVTRYMIPEEVFLAVHGTWMDTDGLTVDDIAEIIGSRHISEILEKQDTDPESVTPEYLDMKLQELIAETIIPLKREHGKSLEEIEREIAQLKQDLNYQHQVTQEVEESRKRFRKLLFITVGISAVLAFLVITVVNIILFLVYGNDLGVFYTLEIILVTLAGVVIGILSWLYRKYKEP